MSGRRERDRSGGGPAADGDKQDERAQSDESGSGEADPGALRRTSRGEDRRQCDRGSGRWRRCGRCVGRRCIGRRRVGRRAGRRCRRGLDGSDLDGTGVADRDCISVAVRRTLEATLIDRRTAIDHPAVDRRAAGQRQNGPGAAAVVGEGAERGDGVLEIARLSETTGGVVGDVATAGRDRQGTGARAAAVSATIALVSDTGTSNASPTLTIPNPSTLRIVTLTRVVGPSTRMPSCPSPIPVTVLLRMSRVAPSRTVTPSSSMLAISDRSTVSDAPTPSTVMASRKEFSTRLSVIVAVSEPSPALSRTIWPLSTTSARVRFSVAAPTDRTKTSPFWTWTSSSTIVAVAPGFTAAMIPPSPSPRMVRSATATVAFPAAISITFVPGVSMIVWPTPLPWIVIDPGTAVASVVICGRPLPTIGNPFVTGSKAITVLTPAADAALA